VVYFTRSPGPPSSPSIVATRGSGTPTSILTSPRSGSPPEDTTTSPLPTPHEIKQSGTLTPSILGHQIDGLSSLNDDLLRHSILRRASQHFPGGSLNFERFETDNIHTCVEFIQSLIERSAKANRVSITEMRNGVKIMATGGGAHKFHELFSNVLGVEVIREDEMECLIEGLKFITVIPDEVYYFSDELIQSVSHPAPPSANVVPTEILERPGPNAPTFAVTFEGHPMPQLPCLLVNIGSGVSLIKVDEDGEYERVSGTSLGGGTLWGLLSLLTPATNFDGE
jgi:type II pantothenate kinase